MDENDAHSVKSGSVEKSLKEEISAQIATLDCAIALINQHHQAMQSNIENEPKRLGWVYSMKDLADWVKYYTDRRRLHCPCCNEDSSTEGVRFVCTECLTEYQFHDEL